MRGKNSKKFEKLHAQSQAAAPSGFIEACQRDGSRPRMSNMQGPSIVSSILQLDLNVQNTAIHSIHKLAVDGEIYGRFLNELDVCLAFSKTNVISKCVEVNSKENLEQILQSHPDMMIMNTSDLFFQNTLLSQLKDDNSLIDRLHIDQTDKLTVLFHCYLERTELHRLMPALNNDNVDILLAAQHDNEDVVKKIYCNLSVQQVCDYIE